MLSTFITADDLIAAFPSDVYPEMREQQRRALEIIAAEDGNATIEAPTGSGKTAIAYTFLSLLQQKKQGPLFYTAPTKTIIEQAGKLHPDFFVMYGRNEFLCLYYPGEDLTADPSDVPCALLRDCAHRVSQETGETYVSGAEPCPYLHRKWQAKQARKIACTNRFYLYTQVFSQEWDTPAGLVIDEAHRIAESVRSCLEYDITDYYLGRCEEILVGIDDDAARRIADFKRVMIRIARGKTSRKSLLTQDEIQELMNILVSIDSAALRRKVGEAIAGGTIDPVRDRNVLKYMERFIHNLGRYLASMGYSLRTDTRAPLNFVYGLYREEREEGERVQCRLVVRGYLVAPIIKKMMGKRTVAMSATIGSPEIFGFETGITNPVHALLSDFPVAHAHIFLPTDTPSLSYKSAKGIRRDVNKTLRLILRGARRFAEHGHRSLIIVTSDDHRERMLKFCAEKGIAAVSYDSDTPAKDVAVRFKDGEGMLLVGTAAQYGEGLDLPDGTAPAIFFVKPDYPHPDDPLVQFEEQRFSRSRQWGLRKWRVMIRSLQVRGRNIRSTQDKGVTFFMSRQFRDIVPPALPAWLWPAMRADLRYDQCIEEALNLLGRR